MLGALALVVTAVAAARDRHARTGLLFNGANKSAWIDQSATNTRVRRVWNPDQGPGTALRFQAYNGDVFPLTPTVNPRAQLVTPLPIRPGGQFWESYEVYVPTNFPVTANPNSWVALGSPVFGSPFRGSPSVGLEIVNGQFRFQRDGYASKPWQIAWQAPVVLGQWIRFTWHVLMSQNGYVQLWMNNQQVKLANGSTSSNTLNMPVLDPGDGRGPWFSQLSAYYKHNSFPQVTVYFRGFRIATTEALAVSG